MSVPVQQGPLMGLEDELVVVRLRELIGGVEGDELADALSCAVDETMERVAPELNRRAVRRELEEILPDVAERAELMDALVEGIEERAVLRPLAQQLE